MPTWVSGLLSPVVVETTPQNPFRPLNSGKRPSLLPTASEIVRPKVTVSADSLIMFLALLLSPCFKTSRALRFMGVPSIAAAIVVYSSFCLFLVARGLRILQSFAAFCQLILLKVFGISSRRATHNP
jgi:hypothetical protein